MLKSANFAEGMMVAMRVKIHRMARGILTDFIGTTFVMIDQSDTDIIRRNNCPHLTDFSFNTI